MTPARRRLQRGIIILPSAFTVGNLFLGVWAIVSAARGHYEDAGWMIVGAAIMDLLDGRIARFTATGTAFGEELDSLVDAISFGVAPALIMYFVFLRQGGEWSWIVSFLYIVAAVFRLARFNIEQAGTAKSNFHGLPSPTAGACVATFYAFTQTALWERYFSHIPAPRVAAWLVMLVALLMVSNVLYPVMPRFNPRSWGGRFAIFLVLASLVSAFTRPEYFFFPFSILYITWGLARSVLLGSLERRDLPEKDPLLDDEEEEEVREIEYEEIQPHRPMWREADAQRREELQ